eukprot:GHVS01005241.1.p1 GENE.GHVS01005241.1~~GHVS01005241.1.p1  ORF type:complete len:346 (-),score=137.57 GHVS01005241.1:1000-1896(-)
MSESSFCSDDKAFGELIGHLQLQVEQKKLQELAKNSAGGEESRRSSSTTRNKGGGGGDSFSPSASFSTSVEDVFNNNKKASSTSTGSFAAAATLLKKSSLEDTAGGNSGGRLSRSSSIPADANIKFPECQSRVVVVAVDTSAFCRSMVLWMRKHRVVEAVDIVVLVTVWEKRMKEEEGTTKEEEDVENSCGEATRREFLRNFQRTFLPDCSSVVPFVVSASCLSDVEVGKRLCATAKAIGATMLVVGSRGLGGRSEQPPQQPQPQQPPQQPPQQQVGSVAAYSVKHADSPVMVVKKNW